MPRALWWSRGGGLFPMSEVPLDRVLMGDGTCISQNVLIEWFLCSQFTHKPVNVFYYSLLYNQVDRFVGELASKKPFNRHFLWDKLGAGVHPPGGAEGHSEAPGSPRYLGTPSSSSSSQLHMETVIIYELGSMNFPTKNDLY